MMDAFECDRCKKLFRGGRSGHISGSFAALLYRGVHGHLPWSEIVIELCSSCITDLMECWHSGNPKIEKESE